MEKQEPQVGGISVRVLLVRASRRFAIIMGVWGSLLFCSAGTIAWIQAWIHLALCALAMITNLAVLLRKNPALIEARMQGRKADRTFDRVILFCGLPVVLALPILAGLDAVRYLWAPLPVWLVSLGVVLHVAGDAIMLWSMVVNPYLEPCVRIQSERGHQVITSGPYAVVRHPMYAGFILVLIGMPFLLGSTWAFLPAGVLMLLLATRSVLEDQMLRRELPGYEAYAQAKPYRLIPGVW